MFVLRSALLLLTIPLASCDVFCGDDGCSGLPQPVTVFDAVSVEVPSTVGDGTTTDMTFHAVARVSGTATVSFVGRVWRADTDAPVRDSVGCFSGGAAGCVGVRLRSAPVRLVLEAGRDVRSTWRVRLMDGAHPEGQPVVGFVAELDSVRAIDGRLVAVADTFVAYREAVPSSRVAIRPTP